MAIIYTEGFENYDTLDPSRKIPLIEKVVPRAEFKVFSGSSSVVYDVTPPNDGKWHRVTCVLLADEHGNLYLKSPPALFEPIPWEDY